MRLLWIQPVLPSSPVEPLCSSASGLFIAFGRRSYFVTGNTSANDALILITLRSPLDLDHRWAGQGVSSEKPIYWRDRIGRSCRWIGRVPLMLSTLIRAPSRLLPAKLEQAVHGHRCLCDALLLVEENWDACSRRHENPSH
jgi:hypothetical protein